MQFRVDAIPREPKEPSPYVWILRGIFSRILSLCLNLNLELLFLSNLDFSALEVVSGVTPPPSFTLYHSLGWKVLVRRKTIPWPQKGYRKEKIPDRIRLATKYREEMYYSLPILIKYFSNCGASNLFHGNTGSRGIATTRNCTHFLNIGLVIARGAGFIPIISIKGINQIKKGKF